MAQQECGQAFDGEPDESAPQALGTVIAPVVTESSDETHAEHRKPLRFVGIGASPGGVEACIDLLQHLAPDTGLAYVVVLHPEAAKEGLGRIRSQVARLSEDVRTMSHRLHRITTS